MPEFATECDMFDLMAQKLAASVISDILDRLGLRDQVMRTTIRPLFRRLPAETVNEALKKIATEHLTEEELKTGTLLREV